MRNAKCTLEDAVLEVFEYACERQDLEVAEHLLRALELIAQRGAKEDLLQSAMLTLARSLPVNGKHS